MYKIIISVSVVLGLVCSSVIAAASVQRGEKAQRFVIDRTDTDGDGFNSGEECTLSQLDRFKITYTDKVGEVSLEDN